MTMIEVLRIMCDHGGEGPAEVVVAFLRDAVGAEWTTTLGHSSTVSADLAPEDWPRDPSREWMGKQANGPGEKRSRYLLECETCGLGAATLAGTDVLQPVLDKAAAAGVSSLQLKALLGLTGSERRRRR